MLPSGSEMLNLPLAIVTLTAISYFSLNESAPARGARPCRGLSGWDSEVQVLGVHVVEAAAGARHHGRSRGRHRRSGTARRGCTRDQTGRTLLLGGHLAHGL